MDDDKNVQFVYWIGRTARISSVGSKARRGRLLAVKSDYLVLHHDKQRVTYYPLDHIQSITIDSMETPELRKSKGTAQNVFFDRDCFDNVFQCLKNQWIQVHNGGADHFQGVLSDNLPDHILLISQSEIIRMYKSHIDFLSYELEDTVYQPWENQNSGEHEKDAIATEQIVNEQINNKVTNVRWGTGLIMDEEDKEVVPASLTAPSHVNESHIEHLPEVVTALVNQSNIGLVPEAASLVNESNTKQVSEVAIVPDKQPEPLKPLFRRRSQYRMRTKKRCTRMRNKVVKIHSYAGSKKVGTTKTIRGANKTRFSTVKNKVTTLWFPKCNKVWNVM